MSHWVMGWVMGVEAAGQRIFASAAIKTRIVSPLLVSKKTN